MVVLCVAKTLCLRVRIVLTRMRIRLEGAEDASCGERDVLGRGEEEECVEAEECVQRVGLSE